MAEIEALVRQLGDRSFDRREHAQQRLAALGEEALPALVARLRDPDPEIARRVVELLPTPRDPARRIDLAVRLLETGDREQLRKAVLMLFQDPGAIDEGFREAVAHSTGLTAAVVLPIIEQLEAWRDQENRYQDTAAAHAARNPEGVNRLSRLHAEAPAYLAEAAYWAALDARDEYLERTTSQPARSTSAPASPPTRPHR